MRGTVKFFKKGWGFITDSDGKDHFVHHSSILMNGYKQLDEGDIVDFEIGNGTTDREQAVNVQLILTFAMVEDALKKENLYLQISEDDCGVCLYRVVDESDILKTDEQGISFIELAAYAGFDVEGLE